MNHTFITVPRIKKGIFIHTLVDAQFSLFVHSSCGRSFDFSIDRMFFLLSFDRSIVMFLSFDLSCTCPFISFVVARFVHWFLQYCLLFCRISRSFFLLFILSTFLNFAPSSSNRVGLLLSSFSFKRET